MPQNKNAQARYLVIDECLRNPGRNFYWETLSEKCSEKLSEHEGKKITVSRRTILDDLKYMESEAGFQAPIIRIRDGRRVHFRYEDRSFSIRNQPLNQDEVDRLKDAIAFFTRLSGVHEFDWVKDILPKLEMSSSDHDSTEIISYESNIDLKNREFLGDVFNAIRYKQVLKVHYHPFTSDPEFYTFHPRFLKQYNNRWFVFGYSPEMKEFGIDPTNFALDRIVSFDKIDVAYVENTKINYQEYFDDIIGVSKMDKDEVKIDILVDPESKGYIETKPIHQSQKPLKHDAGTGKYRTNIRVIPNYEMYQKLMGYGAGIEVIAPGKIRLEMKKKLSMTLKQYSEDEPTNSNL